MFAVETALINNNFFVRNVFIGQLLHNFICVVGFPTVPRFPNLDHVNVNS